MQVDAIKQRPGHPGLIIGGAARRAAASERGITKVAAPAGVHRRDQLYTRGEGHVGVRPGNADIAGFKRLPKRIEDRALEFRKFIEEENTEVGEADLPGADF